MGCGSSTDSSAQNHQNTSQDSPKPDTKRNQSPENGTKHETEQVKQVEEPEPTPLSSKSETQDSTPPPEPVKEEEPAREPEPAPRSDSTSQSEPLSAPEPQPPVGEQATEAGPEENTGTADPTLDVTDVIVMADESWRNCKVKFDELRGSTGYHWWEVIDELCNPRQPQIHPLVKRRGWKTIRLFVSSTFKDMMSEREYLVKRIFPELRIWCEERKLRLVDIDLRWGVPKDADSRETLLTCLSEIDRCYEENDFPFFLNILSERYGWVPGESDVDPDIEEKYKWLPDMSVTAMEIATGAYWSRNPNALYMFRKCDFLDKIPSEKSRGIYIGKEEEQKSLNIMKEKLKEKFPDQVHEYDCVVDGVDGDLLRFSGFEDDLGTHVMEHFKAAIDKQYPADGLGEELTSLEIQQLEHEAYMAQRSQILYGREDVLESVMQYISDDNDKPSPLVLVGSPGSGKSAVVAYVAKGCVTSTKDSVHTFYHFIGATPGSTDLYRVLTRLWGDLLPEENPPTDVTELKRSMETVLEITSENAKKKGLNRVVILIDALNQMDDDGDTHDLIWLPRNLPSNVRVIVSTLEGRCLDALRSGPSLVEVPVNPLTVEHRKAVVNGIFAEYNKKLDDTQLHDVVSKEDAGRPLYLSVACEDLRVFGNFRKLDQKIANLSPDLTGLLTQVLKRIVDENGGDLVIATLCLIETSRFGLLETELLELLSAETTVPSKSSKYEPYTGGVQRLPLAQWALVYLGLRQFLRPSGGSGEGRLDFHHRTISKAVRSLYLETNETKLWWHERLAQYFDSCQDVERKAEELPYHLEKVGDRDRMKTVLLEIPVFERMYAEDRKIQLFSYWRFAGGYEVAASESVDKLQKHIKENGITSMDEKMSLAVRMCWFIIDLGEYDTAEAQLLQSIQTIEQAEGQDSRLLCNVLYPLVHLYFIQAIKVVYNTSPVYKKCCGLGKQYGEQCIGIHRKHYDSKDLHFGKVLLTCGYFDRSCLQEARGIFEHHNYKEGLAETLYNLGEKNQYHNDFNVPKEIFKESLALCKGVFGYYSNKTARCYQLYGQLHWNNGFRSAADFDRGMMETCLGMYQDELTILETLLGMTHPTVVRSREDVIIILQTLGRDQESAELLAKQPADREV